MIRRMTRWSLLAWILLCAVPGPARAGWTSLTPGDGLAGANVTAMLQDRSEDLWFGTYDTGLSRYDGAHWTTYTAANGLLDNFVLSLGADRDGILWVGGQTGVSRFDGATWTGLTPANGLVGGFVYALAQDSTGAMWFGTTAGISRLANGRWTSFTTANGLPANNVHALLVDRTGVVWAGTQGGIARFDGTRWRTITAPGGGPGNIVHAILEDASSALWFATEDGVSRLAGLTWKTYTTADGLVSDTLQTMFQERSGALWVGAYTGGVSRFDGARWDTFQPAEGVPGGIVTGGLEDPRGGVWFCASSGVGRFDGERWTTFDTSNGLAGNYVTTCLVDHAGAVWLGTTDSGVSRFDHGKWTTFTTADGLAALSVDALCEDHAGAIWVGTGGGVSRYDGAAWTSYTVADGLPAPEVTAVAEDATGRMWFGSRGSGVTRFDGTQWTRFTTADGLASNTVHCMLRDHAGALWFGTDDGGVSRYDGASWKTFRMADGLAQDFVDAILEDRADALWFATSDGVSRYDGSQWTTFRTADGMAGQWVTSALQDRSGAYWFGTFGGGVSRYDGERWSTFSAAEGLAANEVYTAAQDSAGALWFGTFNARGASRYTLDHALPRTIVLDPPRGASASHTQSLTAVAAYKDAHYIDFSSSVNGGAWSPWSGDNFLALPLAFPGDGAYTVRVRARDRMGNIDPRPAEARFDIDGTPPLPVVTSPGADATLRGMVTVAGSAADARFRDFVLAFRSTEGGPSDTLASSAIPVAGGALGTWNTLSVPDGAYELRLSVRDTLGLTGVVTVPVVVDNVAPFRTNTSPARVSALAGGDVYTTDGRVHLYFPPRSFARDVTVTIASDTAAAAGAGFAGAVPFLTGYVVAWGGAALTGAATVEVSFPDSAAVTSAGATSLFAAPAGTDSAWRRVGGTLDSARHTLVAGLTGEGRYRLARATGAPPLAAAAGALRFSPRVFSPHGAFATDHVDILFDLERSGPVTVQIHNRAGRLVREVMAGEVLAPGANVVRWDGKDAGGATVEDGLYIATVRTTARALSGAIAVVR